MIVREKEDRYVLIRQHDHGLISGDFARHWTKEPRPLESTLYAIANHDIAWQDLDKSVRWDKESGKPYSFTNYPLEPKLRVYRAGLDLLQARDPYAAYLCSLHYDSLAGASDLECRFREREVARRRRIEKNLSRKELEECERNLSLLQLCDNLSLFVCLNEPGYNEHPWFKNGFTLEGTRLNPIWEDLRRLRLEPTPFLEPFDLTVPYRSIEKDGRLLESGFFELGVTC